jgi:hypothetical protein
MKILRQVSPVRHLHAKSHNYLLIKLRYLSPDGVFSSLNPATRMMAQSVMHFFPGGQDQPLLF